MFRHLLNLAVFLTGLAVIGWIGVGYLGSSPLGVVVILVISACYLAGGLELHRYRQATFSLDHAVGQLTTTPPQLDSWLDPLHPSLRNAVRQRIEGERAALPAPALTPYLVGLLVLLGMLGTLLGMMATLRGTGLALESGSDLLAMRGSLAAPIKGLGIAFGTSIAGVAGSAMLGLLSTLCRRERLQAVRRLDLKTTTLLRPFSPSHQRDEAFKLLQQQTGLMPALIDRLQALMTTIEAQNVAAHERQLASQQALHASHETTYAQLAASVESSLKESVAESTRATSAMLQPAVESTMAALARETATLQDNISQAVQQQLDGLSSGFETATTNITGIWTAALTQHQQSNDALTAGLRDSFERFNATFEQRSSGLLDRVATRMDATAAGVTEAWNHALSQQAATSTALAERNQQALAAAAASFEAHGAALVSTVQQSHTDLQTTLESRDTARLSAWTDALTAMTAELNAHWQHAGEHAAGQQQKICDTLAQTAADITAQTQTHASETLAEISRLVEAASEAPKAAADVVAELRQKLSDSMVRDTAMLEERSRLMATLDTLLDAVNHASTEQRTAVDALVATSADLLDRVGTRFTDHVEAETAKLGTVAVQLTGSAVEVASLGEAFGTAVAMFGESNRMLVERLQAIESALEKSLTRSDEQLAYYVAQAREVVDLSVLSQSQIIEEMQQLAGQRAAGADPA